MKFYVLLGAIVVSFIIGAVGGYYFEKSGIPAKLEDQQTTDKKECEAAQQITKGANDALQKDRDTIAQQLDALKLQHPATCVRVTNSPNIPNSRAKHAATHGNGFSTDWLRTYAAQCENYRSEVMVCTDFLASERQLVQPAK